MKFHKVMIVSTFLLQIFSSCTEVIELDLNETDPQMVVEGYINNQPGPYYVKISRTQNFDEPNTFPPVSGALVEISDEEGNRDKLVETDPGLYATTFLQGRPGSTYFLKVDAEGLQLTASSTMPQPVALDSAYTQLLTAPGGENLLPVLVFRDPAGKGNLYNMTVKRDSWYLPGFFSVKDDVRDGELISLPLRSSDFNLQTGDELTIELQCVEEPVYDYFYVLGQLAGTGMNQSPTPSNPNGNIKGGALGYFSAHTSSVKKITVE